MNYTEGGIILGVLNLVTLIGNIFYTIKYKSVQSNSEILKALTEQNVAKDEIIKNQHDAIEELMRKKNVYKYQYHHKHGENKRLEGIIEALQKEKVSS